MCIKDPTYKLLLSCFCRITFLEKLQSNFYGPNIDTVCSDLAKYIVIVASCFVS